MTLFYFILINYYIFSVPTSKSKRQIDGLPLSIADILCINSVYVSLHNFCTWWIRKQFLPTLFSKANGSSINNGSNLYGLNEDGESKGGSWWWLYECLLFIEATPDTVKLWGIDGMDVFDGTVVVGLPGIWWGGVGPRSFI